MRKLIISILCLLCLSCTDTISLQANSTRPEKKVPVNPILCSQGNPCFQHSSHLTSGKNQECLQCHRAQSSGGYSILFSCFLCHIEEKTIDIEIGRKKRPVFFASFNHIPHLKKGESCTDCHSFSQERDMAAVPFETCIPCHREHDTSLARYQEQNCNLCHIKEKIAIKSPVSFLHSSHISDTQKSPKEKCLECHGNLLQKHSADFILWEKCTVCHTKKNSSRIWSIENKEKKDTFFFRHEEHLTQGQSCDICHKEKKSGEMGFKTEHASIYEKCLSCHPDWKVQNHGSLETCWKCHNPKAPGKTLLAVPVSRTRTGTITLHSLQNFSHHKIEEQCQKCHLRGIEREPKIKQKEFLHSNHISNTISPQEAKEQCLSCHENIENSQSHTLKTFSQKSICDKCHQDQKLMYVESTIFLSRPLFHHKDHTKTEKQCLSCHTIGSNKKITANQDCKICHDHTKPVDPIQELNRCFKCHRPEKIWHKQSRPGIEKIFSTKPTIEHQKTGKCLLCHVSGLVSKEQDFIKKMLYPKKSNYKK